MKEEYTSYKFSADFHSIVYKKDIKYYFIEIVLSFCAFYPLLALASYITTKNTDYVFLGLFIIVPILVMGAACEKVKKFNIYEVVSNVVPIAAIVILPKKAVIIEYILFLLMYNIYFIVKRKKGDYRFWLTTRLIFMNIILALAYSVSMSCNFVLIKRFIFLIALVNMLLSLVYFHLTSSEKLISWEKYESKKDIKNMKNINAMFASLMVAIISIIIFMSYKIGIFTVMDYLTSRIINFLSEFTTTKKESSNNFVENIQRNSYSSYKLDEIVTGESNFLRIIGIIIKFTVSVLIIAVTIFVLISIIQFIYKNLLNRNKNRKVNQKREFIITKEEVSDRIKTKLKVSLNSWRKLIYKTNRDKIRSIYYKTVIQYKKKGVKVEQSNTPRDIENNIYIASKVRLREATEIYEAARYGKEEPTKDMLERIKGVKGS